MIFGIVTLIVIILIVAVLIVLIALNVIKPAQTKNELTREIINNASLQNGFCNDGECNGSPVKGSRGVCNLYETFVTETDAVDKLKPLEKYSDVDTSIVCNDGFLMALQKNKRACLKDECLGLDGRKYKQGQSEEIYIDCSTPDFKQCKNPRSAVVFNIFLNNSGRIATDKIRCLVFKNGVYSAEICPRTVSLNNDVFLDVDQTPTEIGTLLRIRAPGTANCLALKNDAIENIPCNTLKDDGFNWFLTPQLPLIIKDNKGKISLSVVFPPQIIETPVGLTKEDLKTPLVASKFLEQFKSLQIDQNGNLVVGEYSACRNYQGSVTHSGKNKVFPKNDDCRFKTAILSAYTWESIWG